jgi:hypothetical protein
MCADKPNVGKLDVQYLDEPKPISCSCLRLRFSRLAVNFKFIGAKFRLQTCEVVCETEEPDHARY